MAFSGKSDEQCVNYFLSSDGQKFAEAMAMNSITAISKATTEQQKRLKKFKAAQQLLKDLFGNLMMVRRPLSMDYVMKSVAIDNDGETLSMKTGPTQNSLFAFFVANSLLNRDDIYEKTKGINWCRLISGGSNETEHKFRRSVFGQVPESSVVSDNPTNMFLVTFSSEEESALFDEGNYDTAMTTIQNDDARNHPYKKQRKNAQKFRKQFVDAYTVLRGVDSCCAWIGVDPDKICHASQTDAAKLSVAAANMRKAYDAFHND